MLPHSLEPKLKLSSRSLTVLLKIQYLRNSKWSCITADLNILKAPREESKTIRIKTLTSVSCSLRFEVFSCDSCFAGKNSGLLQIEIKVFSRFHRVCLLNSTIATCFRRIQAKFDRFYSNFREQGPLHVHTSAMLNFAHIYYIHSKISLAKLGLSPRGCHGR